MPYPALAVANYFIHKAALEGRQIDPLKLQKLIYFANGWHLALYGRPLVQEPIHAWKYGPVVASVYHTFKHYGAGGIEVPAEGGFMVPTEDHEAREVLDKVWELYGHYSGIQLSNLSHDPQGPWAHRTRSGISLGFGPKIQNEEMQKYFERLIEEADAGR
jgi:uncharacterized phage-associated protein